jgi:hypothetical protein
MSAFYENVLSSKSNARGCVGGGAVLDRSRWVYVNA